MSIKHFFTEEKEKLKGKTPKEIWGYFLDYYAGTTAAALLVLIFVISILTSVFGGKDSALTGILLNTYPLTEESTLFEDFPEYAQIDTDSYDVGYVTTFSLLNDKSVEDIYTMQTLMAGVAAGNTDFFTADWKTFQTLCYESLFFVDLRNVVPAETLEALSDRLYYADLSIINSLQETETRIADFEVPDPLHPEQMKEPIPVGIDLRGCEKLSDIYPIDNVSICLGFVGTSQNAENTLEFVRYILDM